MVQTHVVNTSRKKRNVLLSRSKLLLQVITLRENNKILAKAVAEKAMKICELENEGLSFKNIKLESRESIKSLREYVLNLESMVKKAVSELAGLVNRFTSILSSTKTEKQNVEYLSNLITNDYSLSPPDNGSHRGRNVKSQDSQSKIQEREKHRSSIKRVHPMNLKKSVCVLEPLKEKNDTSLETIVYEKNKSREYGHALRSNESEEIVTKKEIDNEDTSNTCSQDFTSPSTNIEMSRKRSDMHPSSALKCMTKRESSNPKNISKSETGTTGEHSVKVIKKPRDLVRVMTSPRKLRPRKALNYANMLNYRPSIIDSSTRNHHSRTVNDCEESENKLGRKNLQENLTGKKNSRKCLNPIYVQQVKEEPVDMVNFNDTESDFKCLEGLKVRHSQHGISKMHGNGGSTNNYSKRSSNNSNKVRKPSDDVNDQNDDRLKQNSFKRILNILNVNDNKKGCSRSDTHHEKSDKDHGRKSSTLTLPHIGAEESVSIKQEIISPKK